MQCNWWRESPAKHCSIEYEDLYAALSLSFVIRPEQLPLMRLRRSSMSGADSSAWDSIVRRGTLVQLFQIGDGRTI